MRRNSSRRGTLTFMLVFSILLMLVVVSLSLVNMILQEVKVYSLEREDLQAVFLANGLTRLAVYKLNEGQSVDNLDEVRQILPERYRRWEWDIDTSVNTDNQLATVIVRVWKPHSRYESRPLVKVSMWRLKPRLADMVLASRAKEPLKLNYLNCTTSWKVLTFKRSIMGGPIWIAGDKVKLIAGMWSDWSVNFTNVDIDKDVDIDIGFFDIDIDIDIDVDIEAQARLENFEPVFYGGIYANCDDPQKVVSMISPFNAKAEAQVDIGEFIERYLSENYGLLGDILGDIIDDTDLNLSVDFHVATEYNQDELFKGNKAKPQKAEVSSSDIDNRKVYNYYIKELRYAEEIPEESGTYLIPTPQTPVIYISGDARVFMDQENGMQVYRVVNLSTKKMNTYIIPKNAEGGHFYLSNARYSTLLNEHDIEAPEQPLGIDLPPNCMAEVTSDGQVKIVPIPEPRASIFANGDLVIGSVDNVRNPHKEDGRWTYDVVYTGGTVAVPTKIVALNDHNVKITGNLVYGGLIDEMGGNFSIDQLDKAIKSYLDKLPSSDSDEGKLGNFLSNSNETLIVLGKNVNIVEPTLEVDQITGEILRDERGHYKLRLEDPQSFERADRSFVKFVVKGIILGKNDFNSQSFGDLRSSFSDPSSSLKGILQKLAEHLREFTRDPDRFYNNLDNFSGDTVEEKLQSRDIIYRGVKSKYLLINGYLIGLGLNSKGGIRVIPTPKDKAYYSLLKYHIGELVVLGGLLGDRVDVYRNVDFKVSNNTSSDVLQNLIDEIKDEISSKVGEDFPIDLAFSLTVPFAFTTGINPVIVLDPRLRSSSPAIDRVVKGGSLEGTFNQPLFSLTRRVNK